MEFQKYLRSAVAELRPYIPGEDMTGISISEVDSKLETLDGGMIARNPQNHSDQWYVSKAYFEVNFSPIPLKEAVVPGLAYPIETDLSFGRAIEAMENGKRVTRAGWNGKGMFLFMLPGSRVPTRAIHDPALRRVVETNVGGEEFDALPSIRMFTADKKILTGWLASQTDIFAKDWMILADDL